MRVTSPATSANVASTGGEATDSLSADPDPQAPRRGQRKGQLIRPRAAVKNGTYTTIDHPLASTTILSQYVNDRDGSSAIYERVVAPLARSRAEARSLGPANA
jgi:hypothetical protein